VRHRNSVFHDILKFVPWTVFDGLVAEHESDEGTRSFTSRQHLTALLFAQLSGAGSLREIEATMTSHQGRLYHCGVVAPKRSTFADANRNRDFRVFSGLFEAMLAGASRGFRRRITHAVRLIDSTGLRLAGVGAEWARFSTSVFGAKAHVVYDPDLGGPIYHAVTAANVNDVTAAKEMPIEAGATYVFDLGYYDFAFFAKLDALGCRLVTRFKTNTPLNAPRDLPLPPGTTVLSDRIGFLPARQATNRKNPMQDAVREIVVKTETGEILRLMTNDLDAPAQEIADLYKRRWRIELFFRLMKQTLRITKFVGRSENAVRIQIAVALIAHLLLRAMQQITNDAYGFLELVRLVRANIMHRKDPTRLRKPPPPPPLDSRQLQLCFPSP
jgi:IS4 transposase